MFVSVSCQWYKCQLDLNKQSQVISVIRSKIPSYTAHWIMAARQIGHVIPYLLSGSNTERLQGEQLVDVNFINDEFHSTMK